MNLFERVHDAIPAKGEFETMADFGQRLEAGLLALRTALVGAHGSSLGLSFRRLLLPAMIPTEGYSTFGDCHHPIDGLGRGRSFSSSARLRPGHR